LGCAVSFEAVNRARKGGRTSRIYFVEDSPTAALHLRKKLEAMGYEVDHASNGREAWDHLRERHEPLVITDWMRPELSGPDLCGKVREAAGARYTYLILLTVKDLRKDHLEGLQAGADDFLTRPVDSVDLETALRTASRILAAQDQLQKHVAELEGAAGRQ
jgi:DNA-binding response OmpR family regulator